MIDETKITLSGKEQELVCNSDWFLTKRIIIEKVYALFGSLSEVMEEEIKKKSMLIPAEAYMAAPKISKGENYRNLPYVVLDYPRYFTKEDTLAIRTLFWWGNFFSITLHISGICKARALAVLASKFSYLRENNFWICVHSNPWQHHFEEDNFLPLANFTSEDFYFRLTSEPFIKIGKKISLQQWDKAPLFVKHTFSEMLTLLEFSFPNDEKDLSPGIPTSGFDL